MKWHSQHSRHKHFYRLEKVTTGVLSGLPCYHWRCEDPDCRWSTWCYKHEMWPT